MGLALTDGDLVDQKYRIVRYIGSGAWASVYEGVNVRIGRRVAIKVLNDEALKKHGVVDRFEREAQAATRIESDHVVHVFDLGVLDDGRPYIVMELLEGTNLGEQLKERGVFSQSRAVFYAVQALRGLGDAHAAGVTHRDIKPDNMVVLTTKHGDEILKIVDFGISKLQSGLQQVTSMTQTNTILGSPVYMSPEQCRGTRHMDHRSDLYSLGVVLFELLTGELPHKGETFNELMFKIALEDTVSPLTLNPELSPGLSEIVLKSLRREPAERFQSAEEFEDALLDWCAANEVDTSTWSSRRSKLRMSGEDDVVTVKSGPMGRGSQPEIELAATKGPARATPVKGGIVRLEGDSQDSRGDADRQSGDRRQSSGRHPRADRASGAGAEGPGLVESGDRRNEPVRVATLVDEPTKPSAGAPAAGTDASSAAIALASTGDGARTGAEPRPRRGLVIAGAAALVAVLGIVSFVALRRGPVDPTSTGPGTATASALAPSTNTGADVTGAGTDSAAANGSAPAETSAGKDPASAPSESASSRAAPAVAGTARRPTAGARPSASAHPSPGKAEAEDPSAREPAATTPPPAASASSKSVVEGRRYKTEF